MSLTSNTLHSSPVVRIRHVVCRPHDSHCGDIECAECHTVVLPLSGVFLKHLGRDERIVGDRHHVLFFRPEHPYRVSHPVAGGDESLALAFSPQALAEIAAKFAPRGVGRGQPFQTAAARLTARSILDKHRFASRLRASEATALEADERAMQLLAVCVSQSAAESGVQGSRRARPRANDARQRERIEATLVTLSARPEEPWALHELADRVHSSPWHLARTFRRSAGIPLHQFQLLARLTCALDRLLDSDVALATLAADLGFSSHSHFTSSFRRFFGCTPAALRRSARTPQVRELRKKLTAPAVR